MRIHVLYAALFFLVLLDGCNSDPEKGDEDVILLPCVSQNFPANGALVAPSSTLALSWSESVGADSYDVYLGAGTHEPTLIASDLTSWTYNFTVPPAVEVSYSWYVKAKNSAGTYMDCREYRYSFNVKPVPALDKEQKVVRVLVLSYDL